MLVLFLFLCFVITNRTCNNLILDSIEAVLSPFLDFFGVTGFVFLVLLIESFFVSLPSSLCFFSTYIACRCWAEAHVKIARMALTIKLDGNWSSFQLANSAPPLSVTDSAIFFKFLYLLH